MVYIPSRTISVTAAPVFGGGVTAQERNGMKYEFSSNIHCGSLDEYVVGYALLIFEYNLTTMRQSWIREVVIIEEKKRGVYVVQDVDSGEIGLLRADSSEFYGASTPV